MKKNNKEGRRNIYRGDHCQVCWYFTNKTKQLFSCSFLWRLLILCMLRCMCLSRGDSTQAFWACSNEEMVCVCVLHLASGKSKLHKIKNTGHKKLHTTELESDSYPWSLVTCLCEARQHIHQGCMCCFLNRGQKPYVYVSLDIIARTLALGTR